MSSPETAPFFTLDVEGFCLEPGSTAMGGLRLRRFQEEAYRLSEEPGTVVLDAPTGSGKTLALLLAAKRSLDEGMSALILYPTKTLIADQLESMRRLAGHLGLDPELIVSVDADRLHRVAAEEGYGSHGEALAHILSRGPYVLLTNPDVVYYILRMEYRMGRTLFTQLFTVGTVAVDELHLFSGVALQVIYGMLSLLAPNRRLVVSTATHDPEALQLLQQLPRPATVHAEPVERGDRVRWPTRLAVYDISRRPVLTSPEEAVAAAEILLGLLDSVDCREPPCAVAIVNSIAFSHLLAGELGERLGRDEVSLINSLTPPGERRLDRRVVVGTSAIEVGVDFDTPALLFEANNAPSFIQRLGRVSRKRPGVAAALIPHAAAERLRRELGAAGSPGGLGYTRLVEAAKKALSPLPTHAGFTASPEGAASQVAIAYTIARKLLPRSHGARQGEQAALLEAARLAARMLPRGLRGRIEELAAALEAGRCYAPLARLHGEPCELWQKVFLSRLGRSYVKMGVRGAFTSLPAYIEVAGGVLGSVSVTDLPRLDFDYAESSGDLPPRARELGAEPPILVVHGVAAARRSITVTPLGPDGRPWPLGRLGFLDKGLLDVDTGSPALDEKVASVLNGLPALRAPRPSDWRLAALPSRDGWLIIGPDALVEVWLRRGRWATRRG